MASPKDLKGPWPLGKNDKNTTAAMALVGVAAVAYMKLKELRKEMKEGKKS